MHPDHHSVVAATPGGMLLLALLLIRKCGVRVFIILYPKVVGERVSGLVCFYFKQIWVLFASYLALGEGFYLYG